MDKLSENTEQRQILLKKINGIVRQDKFIKTQSTYLNNKPIHVDSKITLKDLLGRWYARLGIGRMKYKVKPGLYSIGNPDENSHIFVSCNYKMSFDILRKALENINAYILVLDTRGINVWCAAAKGTFGTQELLNKIDSTRLKDISKNRTLIVPELGAVGISAHLIKQNSGFSVKYGPVLASDIKEYIDLNFTKTKKMSQVNFDLKDRLAIIPIEVMHFIPYIIPLLIISFLLTVPFVQGYYSRFISYTVSFLGAAFMGLIVFPIMLPLLPFKSFSLKGLVLGIVWASLSIYIFKLDIITASGIFCISCAITSFLSMQYTGASTYTNLSGTTLEVKISLPIIISSLVMGILALVYNAIQLILN